MISSGLDDLAYLLFTSVSFEGRFALVLSFFVDLCQFYDDDHENQNFESGRNDV